MQTVVPKTILLVEDEAIIAMSVQMTLRKYGYKVFLAINGEKAIETVDGTPGIDLILMDINLGKGIDGTEAARRILAKHEIPLIFHSSHTESEVVEKTEGITSFGYIVKDSGEMVLIASIKMAFRLWESEEKFRTAFEYASVGMVLTSTTGELLRVNEAFSSMLGYTPPEIASINFTSLTHPDDAAMSLEWMKTILRNEADKCSFIKRYVHKDGHTIWANVSTVMLRDFYGNPLHFITHVEDITLRKEVEAELRKSNDRLDSILRAVPTGIGMVQGNTRIIMAVNDRICTMTGYSREELVGQSAVILYATQEEYEYVGREKYRQIAMGGTGAVETTWKKKDGTLIKVYLASAPIYPSDLSLGVTFSALDLTFHKELAKP